MKYFIKFETLKSEGQYIIYKRYFGGLFSPPFERWDHLDSAMERLIGLNSK